MKNPYAVLGVPTTASPDEVKKAYRELAKKYHPDNYVNNPLADLAEEKMKEINEAYDAIIKSKSSSQNTSSNNGYNYSQNASSHSRYPEIRRAISENNLPLAEQMLSQITVRDAEWNFLMGSVMLRKGWHNEARSYFSRAYSMDPTNREYAEALNRMGYSGRGGAAPMAALDPCDCCAGLMCADCLCDCF